MISIITPTYNSAKYLEETIGCIQRQTYTDWELLVTDDCSTDDTVAIAARMAREDSRIRLFVLPQNSGAGAARNNSIQEARGRYIAFCDSDDLWMPTKLERQLEFMQQHDAAFCHTSYWTSTESGRIDGVVNCRSQETYHTIRRDDKIGFLTFMYDTDKVGKIYMPLIRKRQDWALIITALCPDRKSLGLQEHLAIYRHRTGSLSRQKSKLLRYNAEALKSACGWNGLKAYLFMITTFLPTYIVKKLKVRSDRRRLSRTTDMIGRPIAEIYNESV